MRDNHQEPWRFLMTFQDSETYHWYTKGVEESAVVIMDPSELPDKVEEVKFWRIWDLSDGHHRIFYAIGKVTIENDLE